MNKPEVIILHSSGGIEGDSTFDTSHQTVETIDGWHKQLGFPKSELNWHVGYHWVIEYSGKVTQTRKEHETGCHVLGMNNRSLGICMVVNPDRLPTLPNSKPSEAQEKALKPLLKKLKQKYNVSIRPHRFYAPNKTCFGRNLPDSWGEDLIKENATSKPIIATLEQQKLDIMNRIIETLRLLILRMQNKLGGSKYA